MKSYNAANVYEAAMQRAVDVYKAGNRVIVAFSAGKDSGVLLEVMIEAARLTGNLPVEMWMRDEEIMFPGTYEYAERIAQRTSEVKFHWFYACQPIINIYNRNEPYYWVFDPQLDPDKWMRKPPAFAKKANTYSIDYVINPIDFAPPPGKHLYVAMGIRASESRKRNMLIHSAQGATTHNKSGNKSLERHFYPIYDWTTPDVWRAVKEKGWDYNFAYDTLTRFGLERERQRIAPPAMSIHGIGLLQVASKAWPEWFERLSIRLPGVRLGAQYGKTVLTPTRRPGETWEQCYQRVNIARAPAWIAERALKYREAVIKQHAVHSNEPIKEMTACPICPMAGTVGPI